MRAMGGMFDRADVEAQGWDFERDDSPGAQWMVIAAVVCVPLAIGGNDPWFHAMFAFGVVFFAASAWNYRFIRLQVGPSGVYVRNPVRRRTYGWDQVSHFEVGASLNGGGNGSAIRVVLRDQTGITAMAGSVLRAAEVAKDVDWLNEYAGARHAEHPGRALPFSIAFPVSRATGSAHDSRADLDPLVGCIVGQLSFDYRVTMNFASQDGVYGERVDALLVIENDFSVTSTGETTGVRPDTKSGYEAVLPLLHSTLVSAVVESDEALALTLSNNVRLRVSRGDLYESWSLSGRGVAGWISGPR
jgi:hypothetical protein